MGKHIPIRECISCHKKGEKSTFVRISKWDNEFFVDCPIRSKEEAHIFVLLASKMVTRSKNDRLTGRFAKRYHNRFTMH